MCGIVGAIASHDIVPVLLEGLRRLEYRGYDSAGMALIDGALRRLRSTGRVAELARLAAEQRFHGNAGIAHTRWATHGGVSERNAHPHVSGERIAVVHNGIIENHEAIRQRLQAEGYGFSSDTDTEVIAHLVHSHLRQGDGLLAAVRRAVGELEGAYAIGVGDARDPARLVCARQGAPLLLGVAEGAAYFASDASALIPVTRHIVYLDEGDVAEVTLAGLRVLDSAGLPATRAVHESQLRADDVDLGPYAHFMQKEIFEQPGAVANTLEQVVAAGGAAPEIFGESARQVLEGVSQVTVLACGTSFHAGLVARHWLEAIAGLPCTVEVASEYRYRDSVPDPDALVVTISQSGETADTIAALKHARGLGHRRTLTVCNVPESTLTRESLLKSLTRAGPEIGVASTKAFTTQLAALFTLSLALARLRGRLTREREAELLSQLKHLPAALQHVLAVEPQVQGWARRFASKHHALFLGRGIHHPIALEGALKLKEISYIHAEAYPAGELKHGPLALVDEDMPVVAIAPNDALVEKLKSNLQEVRARGGELYVVADRTTGLEPSEGVHVIRLSDYAGWLSPILHVLPLQLLAYHTAVARGTDVDKPRNLAKSVTVE
ncbi:MAG: glutamine--fructose-6-phosphate transaminase (isomerizing) [Betaproteobacteria bacterium]|jgi:glucosamine--fructose-6-phosphate aminotransferase (isomerizing)|nr:glutamine--fructose-6-phosphate transaminase (isomerizing) [Rhodocyclaceae bacterium]MCA3142680.1 glutamine--fructose-6-phosphate transaminase (isomerizing) [Rhodocyclaceae bacterium]MCE2897493.1 glutamine--fructose-6-phosphate transaminase (isomerizing) [Betaproteobacteria bacterium]